MASIDTKKNEIVDWTWRLYVCYGLRIWMIWYECYGVLSFSKNIGRNIGDRAKSIAKNLSSIYSKKLSNIMKKICKKYY